MDKEVTKIKRVIWSTEETEKMLNIIRENNIVSLLDGKRYRNAEIYQQVAEKLSEEGYSRSPDQIRIKLKHLKKDFIGAKKNNMTSGSSRMECDFYELLDEIYGTRPVIVTDEDGIQSASPIVQTDDAAASECFERENDSSSSNCRSSDFRPPRPKRLRKNAEEFQHVEENLLLKSHEFWAKEFENQRKHEKELHDSFCENLRSIYQDFSSALIGFRNIPSTSTAHSSYSSVPLIVPSTYSSVRPTVPSSSHLKAVSLYRTSTPLVPSKSNSPVVMETKTSPHNIAFRPSSTEESSESTENELIDIYERPCTSTSDILSQSPVPTTRSSSAPLKVLKVHRTTPLNIETSNPIIVEQAFPSILARPAPSKPVAKTVLPVEISALPKENKNKSSFIKLIKDIEN